MRDARRSIELKWMDLPVAIPAMLAALLIAQATLAAPLDLLDPTPRWLEVRFEISPPEAPGQLDARWSEVRRAYLDRDPDLSAIRIRVPAEEIEAQLRSNGYETIPGSFSDFVWTFDPGTGHVLSAEFSGRVREHLSLGPIRASTLVEIRVEMTTMERGGFRRPRGLFGLETHFYCSPSEDEAECTAVRPAPFDPESGYVNAVGSVHAATRLTRIRAFSPLGEVQFSERGAARVEKAVFSTSVAEGMVRSSGNDGPCPADLGGES